MSQATALICRILDEAGIPSARFVPEDDDIVLCDRTGYHVAPGTSTRRIKFAIIGRDKVDEGIRQGERDAMAQQSRAVLVERGYGVTITEFGHLVVRPPEVMTSEDV